MRSRILEALATLGAFLLFTLCWTWPLAPNVATSHLMPVGAGANLRADPMLTSWMLAWASHMLPANVRELFDANIFHPLPWTLAFSENLLAGAVMVLPVDRVWRNPVLDHNVLLLASFVLTGAGTAFLLRALGAGLPAAWLAGVLVAFNPLRFSAIPHVQVNAAQWMPFALLALERCWRTGRGPLLVALTCVLVTQSSVYHAYFFFVALAVMVPLHWLLGCPSAPGGRWRAVAGIAVAGLVTAGSFVPYAIARDIYALAREWHTAWFYSEKAVAYLGAVADPLDYLTGRYVDGEHPRALIGLGLAFLALVGLGAGAPAPRGGRRTAILYFATAVALALVSLGPMMQWRTLADPAAPGPWSALTAVVPGFAALRVAMRASIVTVLMVGVVAGLGADALWRRARSRLARGCVIVLLIAIGVAEAWRPPLEAVPVPWAADGIPSAYRWLAEQPGKDAVVELPFGRPFVDATYMVLSAVHWRPLLNGYSGFSPTGPYYARLLATFPDADSLRALHAVGVRWVVVHPDDGSQRASPLCMPGGQALAPYLSVAHRDARSCILELHGAPPESPAPPDRRVELAGATITSSTGESAAAAIDGRLDTHWTAPVDRRTETWLHIDLPEPHPIARLVVQLGPHFGEYLRFWRIESSLDGVTWRSVAVGRTPTPPVVPMRADPSQLWSELRIPDPTPIRHVRLVRPMAGSGHAGAEWSEWARWGVHELELFEQVR